MSAGLDAHLVCELGGFRLDATVRADPGQLVAILGPNGAGKSTALRCLAGLRALDGGHIRLDGADLDDPGAGVFVPPERRSVGVVFQDYLLFPHLSALDNVAFGLRARRHRRGEARARAGALLERLGVAGHAHHRPRELSGGQAQRVALARALAVEPRLLLLDEPLAAIDAGARPVVRRDLRSALAEVDAVCLLVTHDPLDAYALAQRVVVIEEGRITHEGSFSDLTARPRSRYVADLVGVNLLRGHGDLAGVLVDTGAHLVPAEPVTGAVLVAIQPHAIALYREPPHGSPRNQWPATVAELDRLGDRVRVRLAPPLALVAEITASANDALALRPGDVVWAAVKATEITTYPA